MKKQIITEEQKQKAISACKKAKKIGITVKEFLEDSEVKKELLRLLNELKMTPVQIKEYIKKESGIVLSVASIQRIKTTSLKTEPKKETKKDTKSESKKPKKENKENNKNFNTDIDVDL